MSSWENLKLGPVIPQTDIVWVLVIQQTFLNIVLDVSFLKTKQMQTTCFLNIGKACILLSVFVENWKENIKTRLFCTRTFCIKTCKKLRSPQGHRVSCCRCQAGEPPNWASDPPDGNSMGAGNSTSLSQIFSYMFLYMFIKQCKQCVISSW